VAETKETTVKILHRASSLLLTVTLATLAVVACGGSGDDGKQGQSTGGGTSPSGAPGSSGQSCTQHYGCVGGCACTEGGNKGKPCCDPEDASCTSFPSCAELCKVCTSS
jgi:hypothetical protein